MVTLVSCYYDIHMYGEISKSSLSCATQKRFCFGNTWIDLVCWYMYTSDIYFLYSLS